MGVCQRQNLSDEKHAKDYELQLTPWAQEQTDEHLHGHCHFHCLFHCARFVVLPPRQGQKPLGTLMSLSLLAIRCLRVLGCKCRLWVIG